ncbi:hypothetical protein CUMW_168660 [Citrus unshiu]|uniref:Uncharacterized protein n=1 Tax=Citrus unshiu TaxID=55188 RepID=A0A2H5PUH6_CITUN|nr:hypothetical protein CUMW_168660 [Citrus unshiu]
MVRICSIILSETLQDLEPFNRMWHLSKNGEPCGQFDVIVIARNVIVPRCNDRTMCKPVVGSSGVSLRMELSSIWTLLAASEDHCLLGSAASFKAPLLRAVSWMENNSEKLFCSQSDGAHCWTLFSTTAYGKRNKFPQIFLHINTPQQLGNVELGYYVMRYMEYIIADVGV